MQQFTEPAVNLVFNDFTGKALDICFGPKALTKESAHYFTSGEYVNSWARLFVPVMQMIADGKTVASAPINYQHPSDQTAYENGNPIFNQKRVDQLAGLEKVMREASQRIKAK